MKKQVIEEIKSELQYSSIAAGRQTNSVNSANVF